ncbi:MAG TPA: helix-turn-helix domain-containing protein [Castellaniella sp.]|uniref:helix-turn-helix domain-containing protein n=1 Tax=Castellaniella sp. TaxID=1955812 RepID=UPI002EF005DF
MAYLDFAPIFKLYGGQDEWPASEMVHCETIATRSRLHNWHIRPHRHSGLYQVLSLHSGKATIWLDDRQHQLEGPGMVEVPQAFVHGYDFTSHCSGHVITIAYPLLAHLVQRLDPKASLPDHPAIYGFTDAHSAQMLHEACTQLQAQYASTRPYREAQIEAWLTLLYARLRSSHPRGTRPASPSRGLGHYTRFCELLEGAYSQHHDVAWFADKVGLTPAHLNVVTRTHGGKSPLQLIHERLALEANRCLLYTPLTIAEISGALGFAEPAHFTRFFRQATGESPRDFRRKAAMTTWGQRPAT